NRFGRGGFDREGRGRNGRDKPRRHIEPDGDRTAARPLFRGSGRTYAMIGSLHLALPDTPAAYSTQPRAPAPPTAAQGVPTHRPAPRRGRRSARRRDRARG